MTLSEATSVYFASFTLIGLAEIGDKSQIVCMVLASRHSRWPVLLGAAAAFLLLNTLAVVFGAGVATWMPEQVTATIVALLFAAFGIHALLAQPGDSSQEISEKPGRNVFLTALSLIFVAELGDKTQLAVAGMASNMALLPVWMGATTALVAVAALGVWVGSTLLQRMPTIWLHRISGAIFLVFAIVAGWQVVAL